MKIKNEDDGVHTYKGINDATIGMWSYDRPMW
jgi:hypothetical protein